MITTPLSIPSYDPGTVPTPDELFYHALFHRHFHILAVIATNITIVMRPIVLIITITIIGVNINTILF